MAKSENPAEASSPARLQRPAARLHPDPGLTPGAASVAGRHDAGRHDAGRHDAGRYDDGERGNSTAGDVGAVHGHREGPGLAKARRAALHPDFADTTRSSMFPDELDAEVLGDDDVLDEAVSADGAFRADAFPGVRFGLPRLGGAKVPLANLEPPSSARVELTPSPVPRVSLSPATGAVDISLVPGPHMAHSRNLPTLAAQHVLGRRHPRRPAPAVTIPPPGDVTGDPLGPSELAPEVRSSKREVVLGLTIGLGLSMLLAVVGQAYLRDEVVAEAQPTPAEVESITLSARPETDARGAALPGSETPSASAASGARLAPGLPGALSEERGAAPTGVASSDGSDTQPAPALAAPPSAPSTDAERLLARAPREASKGRTDRAPRATRDLGGQSAARQSAARARRAPAIAVEPPAFESEKSLSEAPRDRSPMSPAESAGLGLDLPL
jgi:hypothetical protein